MEQGQSFSEFTLLCARAMGACIMLRDGSLDAPIPVFEPSDYSLKGGIAAKAELARLLAMNDEERIVYGQIKKAEQIASHEKWLAKNKAENERLVEMRKQVSAWEPPTSEHTGLKNFMLEQIETSMNSLTYIERELIKDRASFARDYYDEAVKKAQRDIEYHAEGHRKECDRTEARNRWIRELQASLQVNRLR
jgi:hypothetical protein